jgi:hypothetical protein
MPRYAAATIDLVDRGWSATTASQHAPRTTPAGGAATTTTNSAQERVAIWIKGAIRLPKWFETTRAALNALSALPANWNSYGAREIDTEALTGAVGILLAVMSDRTPLPTFVPIANGGVLLEWHTPAADLEITVLSSGRTHVVFEKSDEESVEFEGLPQEVTGRIAELLREI